MRTGHDTLLGPTHNKRELWILQKLWNGIWYDSDYFFWGLLIVIYIVTLEFPCFHILELFLFLFFADLNVDVPEIAYLD